MAKSTGMALTTLSVGDSTNTIQDIRNDVTNFNFSTPRNTQDVTGVDKSAIERLALLADFSITLNGVFNPAANLSHVVFSGNVGLTNRTVNLTMNTKNLNQTSAVLFTDYQITEGTDKSLTWTVPGVLSNGAVPTWS